MKEKIKSNKKEQGITIVVLVVTIIILLILAGVAINMALGENGLFKKSKEAVNTWKSAEENETGVLGSLDREWDSLINGGGSSGGSQTDPSGEQKPKPPSLTGTTIDDIVLPENAEAPTTVTIEGEKVVIPPKFTIAKDSGKTVPEGIVAVDPQGNEWVWIPCYVAEGEGSNIEGRIKYDRYIFGGQVFNQTDNSKIYSSSSDKSYYYHETLSETSSEYQSIKKYGGYYIGRYEAGDKDLSELETPRFRTISDKGNVQTHKVSIKKNQVPYNWVTNEQCITLSEGMTSTDGTDANKLDGTKILTKLCSSYSWDTALKFIEKTHPSYGSNAGTYDGVVSFVYKLTNTGRTIPVCNIYDMGANLEEFITEKCTRSGYNFSSRGSEFVASQTYPFIPGLRNYNAKELAYSDTGFRPTLFVI